MWQTKKYFMFTQFFTNLFSLSMDLVFMSINIMKLQKVWDDIWFVIYEKKSYYLIWKLFNLKEIKKTFALFDLYLIWVKNHINLFDQYLWTSILFEKTLAELFGNFRYDRYQTWFSKKWFQSSHKQNFQCPIWRK